jgi:hypothetical protein
MFLIYKYIRQPCILTLSARANLCSFCKIKNQLPPPPPPACAKLLRDVAKLMSLFLRRRRNERLLTILLSTRQRSRLPRPRERHQEVKQFVERHGHCVIAHMTVLRTRFSLDGFKRQRYQYKLYGYRESRKAAIFPELFLSPRPNLHTFLLGVNHH